MNYLGVDYIEVPMDNNGSASLCSGCAFEDDNNGTQLVMCRKSLDALGSCLNPGKGSICFAVSTVNTP